MKTTLLIALTLLSLTICSQNFAPIGTKWHYEIRYAFSGDIEFTIFEAVRNDTINGQKCVAVSKSKSVQCLDRGSEEYLFKRNDSVFLYDVKANQFFLLYDLSANKGDHWNIYSSTDGTVQDTVGVDVDSVSTSQINGQSLKTLHVTYSYNNQAIGKHSSKIIEKIGDIGYMFNWIPSHAFLCDMDYANGLRCYEDSAINYNTGLASDCNYTFKWTGIENLANQPKLYVYPNPVISALTIRTENLKQGKIIIKNHLGQIIYKDNFSEFTSIDVSTWASGLYFVNYSEEELSLMRRFIKE